MYAKQDQAWQQMHTKQVQAQPQAAKIKCKSCKMVEVKAPNFHGLEQMRAKFYPKEMLAFTSMFFDKLLLFVRLFCFIFSKLGCYFIWFLIYIFLLLFVYKQLVTFCPTK